MVLKSLLLIAALALCACNIKKSQIDKAIAFCEQNGGLLEMNEFAFYCVNGLKGQVE